ncbi:MAG: type VI secretion system contractile sheath large subunit [Planctomycetes bacterium]|nr:type VI secretion system contractile sheath large subunit [Planctomycetota bacterium]
MSQAPSEAAFAQEGPGSNLWETLLGATGTTTGVTARKDRTPCLVEAFLAELSPARALVLWVGPAALRRFTTRRALAQLLARDIARIDDALSAQVNAILHHPRFQRLEASWRGLHYLVGQLEEDQDVKVKVLNVSWKELARDAERAVEFDQSQLFRKVYSEEFGMPGGEPYGVLLGDYEIRHTLGPDHSTDDIALLGSISQVAAASFAPFIAAAHPALFGLESFTQLEGPLHLHRIFEQQDYARWQGLRESEDSRFVGLVLPRVVVRLPYEDDGSREDRFRFREDVAGPDAGKYLWGNAAYAFGAVLIRAFQQSGWLAEIRGVQRDQETGGLVTRLAVSSCDTDRPGVAPRSATEVTIVEEQEKELSDLGFMSLCPCKYSAYSAFYANPSIQKPRDYTELAAAMNARISAMLQYVLCASRFAHYVKILMQHRVGSFASAQELQDYLTQWVSRYVANDASASPHTRARFPLREAEIRVSERPDRPGTFQCVLRLLPHYQLDAVTATVALKTTLETQRTR